jgi:hypothetical protein
LQCQRINPRAPVEIRSQIAVAPRARVAAVELPIGQEIEPLAVGREGRPAGFIAVAGQPRLGLRSRLVEIDLVAAHARTRADEGEVLAVGRPHDILEIGARRGVDKLVLALVEVEQEQLAVERRVGEELAVRRQP